jgi:hypothetical protein
MWYCYVQTALHQKKPELLEHGIIFLQDYGAPYHHDDA